MKSLRQKPAAPPGPSGRMEAGSFGHPLGPSCWPWRAGLVWAWWGQPFTALRSIVLRRAGKKTPSEREVALPDGLRHCYSRPCFKNRFWKSASEGQSRRSHCGTDFPLFWADKLPLPAAVARLWLGLGPGLRRLALFPALFQAKWTPTHAFTLMMNYIIIGVVRCFRAGWEALRKPDIPSCASSLALPKDILGVHCGMSSCCC